MSKTVQMFVFDVEWRTRWGANAYCTRRAQIVAETVADAFLCFDEGHDGYDPENIEIIKITQGESVRVRPHEGWIPDHEKEAIAS